MILKDENVKLSGKDVRAIVVLSQMNLHIWHNESNYRKGIKDGNNLELTHGLNGIRNTAKNKIQEVDKIDINIELFNDKTLYESKNLRSELVSKTASKIAKNEFVRKQLINLQRHFADKPPSRKGSVIDGRDITSVIVPNAEVKFYIDASLEKRAKRRQIQLNLPEKEYEKVYLFLLYDQIIKKIVLLMMV